MLSELLTEIVRNLLVEHDILAAAGLRELERPQFLDGKLLKQA